MHVEKLIQAADKIIAKGKPTYTVGEYAGAYLAEYNDYQSALLTATLRDHYQALLAAERSKVVQEVREWANDAKRLDDYWTRNDVIDYDGLTDKLDSMEQEDGE